MNVNETLSVGSYGYRDLYFRITVALFASHIIIAFGEKESFFELLVMPGYYMSLASSFVIAFLLVCMVNLVTVRLDKKWGWKEHTLVRTILQVCLGLLLPSVAAFLLASAYFRIYGYHILDTLYLKYDFPVIVLMLLLLNVYYLSFYFYRAWRLAEAAVAVKPELITVDKLSEDTAAREVFIVQQGAKNIPLPVSLIAYFYREGDYNFLRTFEDKSFLVSQTLDDVEAQLDARLFFRANRQVIVQYKACTHFSTLEFGKLELFLSIAAKEPIIISQRRAKSFKEWMDR